MKKIYLYPFWLRVWHWFNAFLFLVLIVTGISMHYSDQNSLFMPFAIAMVAHNIAGILVSIIFAFYVFKNIVSGNFKHYIPHIKGLYHRLLTQAIFYVSGIFRGEPHPYEADEKQKFNPLQQITYFGIMFFLMPVIIISGIFMLFPELAPDEFLGMGGVWPMALLHITVGFFLSLFMVGHVYLATTGEKISSGFKAMLTGWHIHGEHEDSEAKAKF